VSLKAFSDNSIQPPVRGESRGVFEVVEIEKVFLIV
jgi:hypothetical protein